MPVIGTPIAPGYVGRYCTSDDVSQYIGELNKQVQADVDGDSDEDPGATEQAIKTAEGRVDLHTGGPWTFVASLAGQVVSQVFNQWAYKLASYELAAKRGFESEDQKNQYQVVKDEVIAEMQYFRTYPMPGADGPDAGDEDDGSSSGFEDIAAPISVAATVDQLGRPITPVPQGPYYDGNAGRYRGNCGWR